MIGFVLAVLSLVLMFYALNDKIVLVKTILKSTKVKKEIKIAIISDFHSGSAKQVVRIVHDVNPDLILIPGDLIDENMKMDSVRELLQGIRKWPNYYVSGNHEFKKGKYHKEYDDLKKMLDEYNVINLDNASKEVDISGQRVWIGGIRDHCFDKSKNPDELDQQSLKITCSKLDKNLFSILLMHRPEQNRFVEKYEIDLVVSGHAHGGQWRFPGINGLFAPQQGLFPKRAGGLYSMKHGIHLVSRGLAHYWFLPRFGNPREINIVIIKRAD